MSQTKTTGVNTADLDRMGFAVYLALVAVGWLMVYAVNYNAENPLAFFDLQNPAGKQGAFTIVSLALVFFIFLIDWNFWRTFALVIYGLTLTLLVGVLFFGKTVKGNTAWFQIGGFTLQPSELAKFGTCLAMAAYLSLPSVNLRRFKDRAIAFAIFMLPILLILAQPDTGSALVFFSFYLVLYREGLAGFWYGLFFGASTLAIAGLVFSPAYVVGVLLLLGTAQLITKLRVQRFYWIGLALLVFVGLFWSDVFTFLTEPEQAEIIDQAAVSTETVVAEGAPAASFTSLLAIHYPWVYTLICAFFYLALFFTNYTDRNVLKRSALRANIFLIVTGSLLTIAANFVVFSVFQPHQQERIKVWLRPQECDPRGSLYNVLHSKMAIGSGGLTGKGYLQGTMTKLKYVPEQTTDFIFCTIGEEQGFIGVTATILLFSMLIYRIVLIAERQRSAFSRIYAYCVAGILLLHFTINIGMTMGLFPIIGIPLPLVSYGGSSMLAFSAMLGVLFKLDSHRYLS